MKKYALDLTSNDKILHKHTGETVIIDWIEELESMHDLGSDREIGGSHFREVEYLHALTTRPPLITESL